MSSRPASPASPFASLWRQRGLLWQFTQRNIQVRHKGSYLGFLWLALTPLLMLALYSFTFGVLLDGRFGVSPDETAADYALGIFLGFTLYGLVADSMGMAPVVMLGNINLVKKVVFPLEVLPAAAALSACYGFLISMGLFMIGFAMFGPPLTMGVLWLPVIVFPLLLLSMGLTWLLAGIGVYYRDVQNVMMFVTTALFYMSGIFYAPQTVAAGSKARIAIDILRYNPVFRAIELSRDVLLWRLPLDWYGLGYLYLTCGLTWFLGYWAFRRLKGGFADVL